MTEGRFNPGSPICEQWEALLADALDGSLQPGDKAAFNAHRAVCPACAALYEEARRGRAWLEFLSPGPDAPAGLLDKILAQTGPGRTAGESRALPVAAPEIPAWQHPGFLGSLRRFAEPRLMMTAAMAFFSITMTLGISGVRLASLQPRALLSLPGMARSFVERRLSMASTPIIRCYDHSRLVYEVQARVRELHQGQEQEEENRRRLQQWGPGESQRFPQFRRRAPATDAPQQTRILARGTVQTGGSTQENQERNTEWTA